MAYTKHRRRKAIIHAPKSTILMKMKLNEMKNNNNKRSEWIFGKYLSIYIIHIQIFRTTTLYT